MSEGISRVEKILTETNVQIKALHSQPGTVSKDHMSKLVPLLEQSHRALKQENVQLNPTLRNDLLSNINRLIKEHGGEAMVSQYMSQLNAFQAVLQSTTDTNSLKRGRRVASVEGDKLD